MPLSILLLEDNDDTRQLLTILLTGAGHEVRATASVQAALRQATGWRFDLLLCDLGLPDGTGGQLLRTLHAEGRRPYAIVMSGLGATTDIAASRDAGFRHHLVKPIEIDELEGLIERAATEIGTTR